MLRACLHQAPPRDPSRHRPQLLGAVSADLRCPAYLCHCGQPSFAVQSRRVWQRYHAVDRQAAAAAAISPWRRRRRRFSLPQCRRRHRNPCRAAIAPLSLAISLRPLPPLSPPRPGPVRSAPEGTICSPTRFFGLSNALFLLKRVNCVHLSEYN